jgi:hypothetical protein
MPDAESSGPSAALRRLYRRRRKRSGWYNSPVGRKIRRSLDFYYGDFLAE